MSRMIRVLLLPLVLVMALAQLPANPGGAQAAGTVTGTMRKWQPVTVSFSGPYAYELDSSPNPFLDYRLQVTFRGPSGQTYNVPGYFDGDGKGGGRGSVWRVKFLPDQAGTWYYKASFRKGTNIAIDLNPSSGTPTGFDGASGSFVVGDVDASAPAFFRWGRLQYVGGYYLKFKDGPYWIKGGTDSPETFLGYDGFDNTPSGPYGILDFVAHVRDWTTGDPVLNTDGADAGKGMIGALNYLGNQHVNSVYFLVMNIGGDGRNVWPYAGKVNPAGSSSDDNTHIDISKMRQWDTVFLHAQKKGIYLHFVLNEAETANKKELDGATLGVERKLFYRELVARFGYLPAIQWNISEEYNLDYNLGATRVKEFAGYIQQVDPYDHPITVHNYGTDLDSVWGPFLGDSRFSVTSFQLESGPGTYDEVVESWRRKSRDAGRPIPIALDELNAVSTSSSSIATQRKAVIWPVYLSGGNLEHYLGGPTTDKTLDDFRQYETLWRYTWYARKFMQDDLPFWQMEPADGLLSGESTSYGGGQVLAKKGEVYAIYLPDANPSGKLDLSGASGTFVQRWYNPRTGSFEGTARTLTAGSAVSLGAPPSSPDDDWVVLIQKAQAGTDTQPPSAPRNLTVTSKTSGSVSLKWNASTDNVGVAGYAIYANGSQVGTTSSTSYTVTNLSPSTTYTFVVKAYDAAGNLSAGSNQVSVQTSSAGTTSSVAVTRFVLINADTDQPIMELKDGMTLSLSQLPTRHLNIRADTSPSVVGSVRFGLNSNPDYRLERNPPYALAGDSSGDYRSWTPATGTYQVTATPYTSSDGSGTPGSALTIRINVIN